jgi:magnesium-transporting ATPase (P-type)
VRRSLKNYAQGQTSAAIPQIISLQPKTARLIRNGREIDVLIEQVEIGDVLLMLHRIHCAGLLDPRLRKSCRGSEYLVKLA